MDATNLMVLNWEKHKTLRILAQERLISLLWLKSGCYHSSDLLLDLFNDGLLDFNVVEDRRVGFERLVLLVRNPKVELLRRRIAHLEGFNTRRGLEGSKLAIELDATMRWGKVAKED